MIYPSGSGLYYAAINDPGHTLFKIGRDDSLPSRLIKESKETLCLSPEKYLHSAILYYLDNEKEAETIVHRYFDLDQRRYNSGCKKEIFVHVTPEMIETILTENHISFKKVTFSDFYKHDLYTQILNKKCQDFKIILGDKVPKQQGVRDRCELIATKGFYVREFLNESNRLSSSVKISYYKYPEHTNKSLKEYNYRKKDFEWDIRHGFLTISDT